MTASQDTRWDSEGKGMSKETTDMEYPSPQQHLVGKAEAFDRIVAARKKHVDAVAAYNARREYVNSLPFDARFNLDAEYRAFSDAQSEFIKVAQEVTDAALASEGQAE